MEYICTGFKIQKPSVKRGPRGGKLWEVDSGKAQQWKARHSHKPNWYRTNSMGMRIYKNKSSKNQILTGRSSHGTG